MYTYTISKHTCQHTPSSQVPGIRYAPTQALHTVFFFSLNPTSMAIFNYLHDIFKIYVYIYTYIYIYTCVYKCTYACIYICLCIFVFVQGVCECMLVCSFYPGYRSRMWIVVLSKGYYIATGFALWPISVTNTSGTSPIKAAPRYVSTWARPIEAKLNFV